MDKEKLNLKVDISADSRYKFDRKRIREAIEELLLEKGLTGKVMVGVAMVGERKMKQLKKKYTKEERVTDVLSFSQTEGEEIIDVEGGLDLGEVVVCYPQAKKQAMGLNRLLDEEIEFLVLHGVTHLLGIHHD